MQQGAYCRKAHRRDGTKDGERSVPPNNNGNYLMRLFLFTLIAFLLSSQSLAHSGNTDASGGHNCSQKSVRKSLCIGYHYHHDSSGSIQRLEPKNNLGTSARAKTPKYKKAEDAEAYLHGKIWKLKPSDIDKIQRLYAAVENELTQLKCDGDKKLKVTFLVENEIISTSFSTTHISFNDEYLFFRDQNIWMLLGKKIKDKWVSQNASSQLNMMKSSISWGTVFPMNPLGDLDIATVYDLGFDGDAFVSSYSISFQIDRHTGAYYSNEHQSFRMENSSIPSFTNDWTTKGKCRVLSAEANF